MTQKSLTQPAVVRSRNRLREADCSVMPALVSGDTTVPTMMIADPAAIFY